MNNLQTEVVVLDKLKADEKNAREHDSRNLAAIKSSLNRFGQRKPLVVWKGIVVAGNGTLAAMRELGWKEAAVARIPDDWSEQEVRAFAIADNRTAELANWNGEQLQELLEDFDAELLEDSGFTEQELEDLSQLWGSLPDLDELAASLEADSEPEDGMVAISFRTTPDMAERWNAALQLTGLKGLEAINLVIQAAFDALSDD